MWASCQTYQELVAFYLGGKGGNPCRCDAMLEEKEEE